MAADAIAKTIAMTFPKSGKIKVTPEESRIVQKRLFKEGYRWRDTETLEAIHTDAPFLFWDDDMLLWDNDMFAFADEPCPEYTMSLFTEQVEDELKDVEDLFEKVASGDMSYWDAFTQFKSLYTLNRK